MNDAGARRLGFDRESIAFLVVVGTLVGAGVGLASPYVVRWLGDLAWVPFQGPLELVGSFDPAWVWGRPLVGAALGIGFAAYIVAASPVLLVTESEIEVSERGVVRRIRREQVSGVFRDGGALVVESAEGRVLFRGDVEGGREAVREAFVTRGYPWEAE